MAGRIAVVDANNQFLRWEARRIIHEHHLPHRSVHVLVFDLEGRLVIQRRHRDKQTYASYWDVSCAGHVEESDYLGGPDERLDEVYADVARRELREELGVMPPLERLSSFSPLPGTHYEHLVLYRAVSDGPFTLQPEEVEAIQRVTFAELDALTEPLTPMLINLTTWLRGQ